MFWWLFLKYNPESFTLLILQIYANFKIQINLQRSDSTSSPICSNSHRHQVTAPVIPKGDDTWCNRYPPCEQNMTFSKSQNSWHLRIPGYCWQLSWVRDGCRGEIPSAWRRRRRQLLTMTNGWTPRSPTAARSGEECRVARSSYTFFCCFSFLHLKLLKFPRRVFSWLCKLQLARNATWRGCVFSN